MKEPVRRIKNPWMAGTALSALAVAFFVLAGNSGYREPGKLLDYNNEIQKYIDLDNIPTNYKELPEIDPKMEDASALSSMADGTLYVSGKDTVAKFNGAGVETARYAITGTPLSMAVAPSGKIYLGMDDHIEVFDPETEKTTVWEKPGAKTYLTSLAVNDEYLFAADYGHREVLRYTLDGKLDGRFGKPDPGKDIPGLVAPSPHLDLAISEDDYLWVVNPGMLGIESYRFNGDFVTSWYNASMELDGFAGCCNPAHIAFTRDGRLITCEKGLVRVKVFEPTMGEFEELVAGSRMFPGEQEVRDLAVDAQNRILVLDPRHNAVRVFEQMEVDHGQTNQPA